MARLNEYGRLRDRNDPKWAHPEFVPAWALSGKVITMPLSDSTKSREEKLAFRETVYTDLKRTKDERDAMHPEVLDLVNYEIIQADGCIEEPDTQVELHIVTHKKPSAEKRPVIFYVCGGGLVMSSPLSFNLEALAIEHNAVIVCPFYRNGLDAPYPAAINDLHAGYQWLTDHADELNVDADRVVITGTSSGGHLSLALAFRLKRYGFHPRGCVVNDPMTDDRMICPSDWIRHDGWDSEQFHSCATQWMGDENINSAVIGPEAFANHASVEDCRGLCPVFMHVAETDVEADHCLAFAAKLHEADVYTELHQWGGVCHGALHNSDGTGSYSGRFKAVLAGNIDDCLNYDLRRLWLDETQPKSNDRIFRKEK